MTLTEISGVPVRPVLLHALSAILPTAAQTRLLRATLHSGEAGREAWESWYEADNPILTLREDGRSIKKLLPLLHESRRRNSIDTDKELGSYLRAAHYREELRTSAYRDIARSVFGSFETAGIGFIALKGAALADAVYQAPALRHSHDINVLIREADLPSAIALLPALGFEPPGRQPGAHEDVELRHESGLPLVLHRHLFKTPFYNAAAEEVWARSEVHDVAGLPTRILSPADNLMHVCGYAASHRNRASLVWVCDSWMIIDHDPDLDWDALLDSARRSHLALPLCVTLGYLAHELGAPLPASFLRRLHDAAARAGAVEREAALLGARAGDRGSLQSLVMRSSGWAARLQLLQWVLLPSPAYLRWVSSASSSWLLPFYYVYHPLKYIARGTLRRLMGRGQHRAATPA